MWSGAEARFAVVDEVEEPAERIGVDLDVPPGVGHQRPAQFFRSSRLARAIWIAWSTVRFTGLSSIRKTRILGLGDEDLGEPRPELLVDQVANRLDRIGQGQLLDLEQERRQLVAIVLDRLFPLVEAVLDLAGQVRPPLVVGLVLGRVGAGEAPLPLGLEPDLPAAAAPPSPGSAVPPARRRPSEAAGRPPPARTGAARPSGAASGAARRSRSASCPAWDR